MGIQTATSQTTKRHRTVIPDENLYQYDNQYSHAPTRSNDPALTPKPAEPYDGRFGKGFQPPWWATEQGRNTAGEVIGAIKGIWDAGQGARAVFDWIAARAAPIVAEVAPVAVEAAEAIALI
jgi:hypothetical protein